jgi:hypothetical protein
LDESPLPDLHPDVNEGQQHLLAVRQVVHEFKTLPAVQFLLQWFCKGIKHFMVLMLFGQEAELSGVNKGQVPAFNLHGSVEQEGHESTPECRISRCSKAQIPTTIFGLYGTKRTCSGLLQ